MTGLLEIRERVMEFYGKYEIYIVPVMKLMLALFVLFFVNGELGYMNRINSFPLVLIVVLMCSFLPIGAIVLFGAMFSLLHMYSLSLEVALVGGIVFMIVFLMFGRFSTKESLVIAITPLTCGIGIPYVMPVVMGLLGSPASAVSVCCGLVIYYLLQTVSVSAATINTMGDEEMVAKVRLLIDGLVHNKAMFVLLAASAVTVIIVYLLKRMSVQHAWTIAIVAGVMVELIVLLVGDLLYDTNISVVGVLGGAVLTVLVAKVVEFFRFCVDYSRTEKVQFEDDEYYYYVKAVPKMSVTAPTNTVKKINTKSVLSRVTPAPKESQKEQPTKNRRSVTIGSDLTEEDYEDIDYDDIF